MSYFKNLAYGRFSSHDLSVVPLFLLMGNIASKGGLSRRLFEATNAFLGHYPGGVAMSAIGACAGFWRDSAVPRWPLPPPWARSRCPCCAAATTRPRLPPVR